LISTREIDQTAEQNFISNATSKPASDLIQSPDRDSYSYDSKPSVTFSTPAISALHARIGLPSAFPLSTLRRCLTDPSVEQDHKRHNEALSVVGSGLLDYHVSEYLSIRWPRLPLKTQVAALWAYTGESALARISREWGVQPVPNSRRKGKKKRPVEIENAPVVSVNIPKREGEAPPMNYTGQMDWERKEQERVGWVEREESAEGASTPSQQAYEQKFILLALQRFVQALVGGVYVHSVRSS
jgi:dsRNA-specific ribonuclease